MSDLLGYEPPAPRKSASHGEAGYERIDRDAYFTEPWVTQALLDAYPAGYFGMAVWEPACGDGRMADVIHAAGYVVGISDIHDYGCGAMIRDFLRDSLPIHTPITSIITNPPFDLAKQFVVRALECVKPQAGVVAMVQRHEFDAPKGNRPFFQHPFAAKLILPRRPRWSDSDKASPRFPYAWYVWDWKHQGAPIIRWIGE